jgi:hypothetical protein
MAETRAKQMVKKAATPKTATTKKPASSKRSTSTKKNVATISDQERYEMIQYAAYFIAERNSFVGDTQAFWAEAEAQINGM